MRSFPCSIIAVSVAVACAAHRAPLATPTKQPGPEQPKPEQPRIIRVFEREGAVELVYVPWMHDPAPYIGKPEGATGIMWHFFGPSITMEIMRLTESLLDGASVIGIEGSPPSDYRSRFAASIEYLRLVEQQGAAGSSPEKDGETSRVLIAQVTNTEQRRLLQALLTAEFFVVSTLLPGRTQTEVLALARRTNTPMVGVEDPELHCRIGRHMLARHPRTTSASTTIEGTAVPSEKDELTQKQLRWREVLDEYLAAEQQCGTEESQVPFCRFLAMNGTTAVQAVRALIETPELDCLEQPLLLEKATLRDVEAQRTDRAIENLLSAARAHGARRAVLLFGARHTGEVIASAKQRGLALTIACAPHICEALAKKIPSLAPTSRP